MKQTAVEWLFEQLDISQGYQSAIKILKQAKEMEKVERINLSDESYSLGLKHGKQMYRGGFDGSDGPILK
jgi:hypothetical protein